MLLLPDSSHRDFGVLTAQGRTPEAAVIITHNKHFSLSSSHPDPPSSAPAAALPSAAPGTRLLRQGEPSFTGAPVLSAPQYLYRHYTRGRYKGITLKGKRLIDAQLLVWIRICLCTFVNALCDFCSVVNPLTQIISLFRRAVHINAHIKLLQHKYIRL